MDSVGSWGKRKSWTLEKFNGHPKTLGNFCDYFLEVGTDIRFIVDEIKHILINLEEIGIVPENSHVKFMNIYNVKLDFDYSEFLRDLPRYDENYLSERILANC